MTGDRETLDFTTETRQILHLMVHSLYSNREIFLRELISNASDALDKLRFESYSDPDLLAGDGALCIEIEGDPERGLVRVRDNGVGMTRDEVVANIGTIAKSGTAEFLERLRAQQDQAERSSLIGQFGVGFYSSFIVADEVELLTRRAGTEPAQGVYWRSDGGGTYSIEPAELPRRGTEVVLHLKEDCKEFADPHRLRAIIHRYSDHITFPIRMPAIHHEQPAGDEAEEAAEQPQADSAAAPDYETVNKATAIWARPKNEISNEEYDEFYRQTSYDFEPPLAHLHSRVEGKQEYTALLYIPSRAPFDLWDRERRHGVKLYVKRVFIMDDAEHLMPAYLRFVRGVIDSDDLPLNISREILQDNKLVDGIRAGCTRKVLDLLAELADKEPEKYAQFWSTFGRVLKEGVVEDAPNRERIAGLLRFSTTRSAEEHGAQEVVALKEYLERLAPGQERIYYITADTHAAAAQSPHLEVFRERGIEVLLLSDPIDEWLVSALTEFDGKPLQSVAKGEVDLAGVGEEKPVQAHEHTPPEAADALTARLQEVLGERVESVRVSRRLTQSPVCLVVNEHAMSKHLERIMQAAGQQVPGAKPILEVNPDHPLMRRVASEEDGERFAEWAALLLDEALLAEGAQLSNPGAFLKRMNRFLAETGEQSRIILPS